MTEKDESPKIQIGLFTSKRMEAIWEYAHYAGYKNLAAFWKAMKEAQWGFYDVLKEVSP